MYEMWAGIFAKSFDSLQAQKREMQQLWSNLAFHASLQTS